MVVISSSFAAWISHGKQCSLQKPICLSWIISWFETGKRAFEEISSSFELCCVPHETRETDIMFEWKRKLRRSKADRLPCLCLCMQCFCVLVMKQISQSPQIPTNVKHREKTLSKYRKFSQSTQTWTPCLWFAATLTSAPASVSASAMCNRNMPWLLFSFCVSHLLHGVFSLSTNGRNTATFWAVARFSCLCSTGNSDGNPKISLRCFEQNSWVSSWANLPQVKQSCYCSWGPRTRVLTVHVGLWKRTLHGVEANVKGIVFAEACRRLSGGPVEKNCIRLQLSQSSVLWCAIVRMGGYPKWSNYDAQVAGSPYWETLPYHWERDKRIEMLSPIFIFTDKWTDTSSVLQKLGKIMPPLQERNSSLWGKHTLFCKRWELWQTACKVWSRSNSRASLMTSFSRAIQTDEMSKNKDQWNKLRHLEGSLLKICRKSPKWDHSLQLDGNKPVLPLILPLL